MPTLMECLREQSAIIVLKKLKNGQIGLVTQTAALFLVDPDSCVLNGRFQLPASQLTPRNCAFSPDGRYFAFTQYEPNAIRVIDLRTKQVVRSYATQEHPVELLTFDPRSSYLVAGTKTGRVFVWRTESTNLIARLSSFPEYDGTQFKIENTFVSTAAFKGTLIATSGYGGSIVVTNLQTQANTQRIKPGKVRIDAISFLDESRLLSGNIDGVVSLIHLDKKRPIQRTSTTLGPIAHLLVLPNQHFALAASKYNHIALIKLDTMRTLDNAFISVEAPIRSLCLADPNTLFVGLEDGSAQRISLAPLETFDYLIQTASYVEAYALSEHEPLLQQRSSYKQLENIFSQAYEYALQQLCANQTASARDALSPFMGIPSKEQRLFSLFEAFEHYPRLLELIKKERYNLIYSLTMRFPLLTETPAFNTVEEQWNVLFTKAQRLVLTGQKEEAKKLLYPFNTVAGKSPFIRLLLDHPEAFIEFSRALDEKDFPKIKQLSKSYPVLQQTPTYRALVTDPETLTDEIIHALKRKAFEKADILYTLLCELVHSAENSELGSFIDKSKKLNALYEKKKLMACYEFIDTHPELSILPLTAKLEAQWMRQIKECESAALVGNVVSIKKILGPLILLKTRSERTGNLLRVSYQMQIKLFLSKDLYERAKEGIFNYIDFFGMDVEVRQIIKLLAKRGVQITLTQEQQEHRHRSLWLVEAKHGIADSISDQKK